MRERRRKQNGKLEPGSSRGGDEESLEPHSGGSFLQRPPALFSSSSSVSTGTHGSSHPPHTLFFPPPPPPPRASSNNTNKQQFYKPNPLHQPPQPLPNNPTPDNKRHIFDINSSHRKRKSGVPNGRFTGPCNDYIVTLPPQEVKPVVRKEHGQRANFYDSVKVEKVEEDPEEKCISRNQFTGKKKLACVSSTSTNAADFRKQVDSSHHQQFGHFQNRSSRTSETLKPSEVYSDNSYQHLTTTDHSHDIQYRSLPPSPKLHNNSSKPNYAYGCKQLFPYGPEVLVGLNQNRSNKVGADLGGDSNEQKPVVYSPVVKHNSQKRDKDVFRAPSTKNLVLVSELQRQLSAPVRPSNNAVSGRESYSHYQYPCSIQARIPEISITPMKIEKTNEYTKYTGNNNGGSCRTQVPVVNFWSTGVGRRDNSSSHVLMEPRAQNTEQHLVRNRRSLMQSTPRRLVREGECTQQLSGVAGTSRQPPSALPQPPAFSTKSTSSKVSGPNGGTTAVSNGNSNNIVHELTLPASYDTEGSVAGDEVLDLRKSVAEKLCVWCGKRTGIGEDGVGNDYCSEVCFDLLRRDTFKKRSNCLWCSSLGICSLGGGNPTSSKVSGSGNTNGQSGESSSPCSNSTTAMDETKFCSEECLTHYKVKLFCDETSAHLEQFKGSNLNGPASGIAPNPRNPVIPLNELITPELWLRKQRAMGNGSKQTSASGGILFSPPSTNRTALSSDGSTPAVSPHSSPNSEASSVPVRPLIPASRHSSSHQQQQQQKQIIIQNHASGIMNPLFVQNGHTSFNGNGQTFTPTQHVNGRRRASSPQNCEQNVKSSRKRKQNHQRSPSLGSSSSGGVSQSTQANGVSPQHTVTTQNTLLQGPLAHGSGGGIQSPSNSRANSSSTVASSGQNGGAAGQFSPPMASQRFHGPSSHVSFPRGPQQQHMGMNGNIGFQSLLQQTQALLSGFGSLPQLPSLSMMSGSPGPFGSGHFNQPQGDRPFPNFFPNMPYSRSMHTPRLPTTASVGTQTIEGILENPLNLSGAPPITVMVPYPVAFPIPIPIPIILPDEYVLRQVVEAVRASQSEDIPSATIVDDEAYGTGKLYIAENPPSPPPPSETPESEKKERSSTSTVEIAVHDNGDLRIIRTIDEDGNVSLSLPGPSGMNSTHLRSVVVELPEKLRNLMNAKEGSFMRGRNDSENSDPPVLRIEDVTDYDNDRVHSNAGGVFRAFLRSDASQGDQQGSHQPESNGN